MWFMLPSKDGPLQRPIMHELLTGKSGSLTGWINAIRREIELFSTEKNGDPIQISMSMGVASSREGPMQKVFDLADERQYEDKREVKKRLGITAYRSHDHVS